jgi:F-type H+-transporting ATPase subunit delta
MKASVKQYAQSLFELVVDKPEEEAKKIVSRFITFLHRRQDLNKAEAIIAEFNHIYEEASGERQAELISARPLSASIKEHLNTYLSKRVGIAKFKLIEVFDPELIGGFILRYQGLVIDGSLKNNLQKFKKQLSN